MVIRVSLQVVQEDVGHQVIRVPGVLGAAPLVAAAGGLLPLEAVVLEVVDGLEEAEPVDGLDDEPRDDGPAEHRDEADEQHDGHEPGVDVVVANGPGALVESGEAFLFECPRGAQRAEHGAGQEHEEGLAEARAGRVLRRRDASVVAAVVLDVEVPVAGGGEGDLGQPLLAARDLVAEFVRGVDADAAGDADRPCDADRGHDAESAVVAEPAEVVRGPQVAGEDQRRVLERDVEVRAPPVVGVRLKAVDDVVRGVGAVASDGDVAEGDDDEDEDRQQVPRGARGVRPADVVEAADEGDREEQPDGGDESEEPEIPLGVGPRIGLEVRVLGPLGGEMGARHGVPPDDGGRAMWHMPLPSDARLDTKAWFV